MRSLKILALATALSTPAALSAGQIYGTITAAGKGVSGAQIEINCAGAITPGATAADGSYRINVAQEGQCSLALPGHAGRPSAVIFSNPNPSLYNFELVPRGDGNYELRRR